MRLVIIPYWNHAEEHVRVETFVSTANTDMEARNEANAVRDLMCRANNDLIVGGAVLRGGTNQHVQSYVQVFDTWSQWVYERENGEREEEGDY